MRKIFVSHSAKVHGIELARELSDALDTLGYKISSSAEWFDAEMATTQDQLRTSHLVIGLITDESPNLFFELGYAAGAGRRVLLACPPNTELPNALKAYLYIRTSYDKCDAVLDIVTAVKKLQLEDRDSPSATENYRDLLRTYRTDRAYFDTITSSQFEEAMYEYFRDLGYGPHQSEDSGFDIHLRSYAGFDNTFVECRKYNVNSKVSVGHVQQLLGVVTGYKADHGIIVTTSDYTRSAIDFAQRCAPKIDLWTMDNVLERL